MSTEDDLRNELDVEQWTHLSNERPFGVPSVLEVGAGKFKARLSVASRYTIPVVGALVAGLAPALTVWSPSLTIRSADSPTMATAVICGMEIAAGLLIATMGFLRGRRPPADADTAPDRTAEAEPPPAAE